MPQIVGSRFKESHMLWFLALVSFVLWVVLFVFFHAASGLVDVVLVVAMVAAVRDLVADRRRVT